KKDFREIRGIVFCLNDKIVVNKKRSLIDNLDILPFPSWDLIEPHKYPPIPHQFFYKYYPVAPIITSRGCPYSCYFCAVPYLWSKKFRRRSTKNVVDEMEYLVNTFGIKEIHIEDDSFTLNKAHVMSICKEVISRNLRIAWSLPNGIRVDTIDEEIVAIMKESGCYQVGLGIESSNEDVLRKVNKNIMVEKVKRAVRLIKKYNIEIRGFFMIGIPGETLEDIKSTIKYSHKLNLNYISFGICYPIPGSKYFENYYESYRDIKWDNMKLHRWDVKFLGKNVRKILKYWYISYYLNISHLYNVLKRLKLRQVKYLVRNIRKIFL
ncbi:MAG: B12-binding domain-containing radical SAM protein, partial [Promethearchaeota archaeon]